MTDNIQLTTSSILMWNRR